MSTVILGANAKLELGAPGGGRKVDVTADGLGTGDIARTRTYDARPVPGSRGRGSFTPTR